MRAKSLIGTRSLVNFKYFKGFKYSVRNGETEEVLVKGQTKTLPLFPERELRETPRWHKYRCPKCGDETLSEIRLSWIRCPRCKRWYPAREEEGQD